MAFVVDASVCAVWALEDEASPLAEHAMDLLQLEGAIVPAVWWFEIRNVLLISERRKRLQVEDLHAFLEDLKELPIRTDQEADERAIFRFARKYQLSFYDAAYMEVASRFNIPLATLDKGLRSAAESAGVPLLA
jgi:predicted nucleic acid-binding protein